jgi:RNA recognition motif-containing protein
VSKNVYVGNMSFDTTEATLRQAFEAYGEVTTVNIVTDRYSGRPRGFAFVEMATDEAASAAIAALNGQDLDGRTLKVDEAKPRRSSGGGGGGDRGGGRDRW